MALDPRKQEIFEAWFDYDHALDEDTKGAAKCKRNDLIRDLLASKKSSANINAFLDCFRKDYIEWMHSSGHKKSGRKRF